ncbi:hypothetical protein [Selenomonas sputigena]|uniref:hypothetical protein n=1 Tax=Selenomonas sputigena TaxID=69823 RepID=UPI002234AAF8|nr:hypothetical protein [Selenomonas sputigena]UZE45230.1 hypothetical protein OL236_11705 [Selenomonas sputigena]
MWKKFLFVVCVLLLLTASLAGAEAAAVAPPEAVSAPSGMEMRLKLLAGEWLSPKGTLILEVEGQKINGCEITKYEDLVDRSTMGTTVFWILEEEGERMMQLDWRIQGDDSDYIFLDGRLKLHRASAL